jgi:hypothetical protein
MVEANVSEKTAGCIFSPEERHITLFRNVGFYQPICRMT